MEIDKFLSEFSNWINKSEKKYQMDKLISKRVFLKSSKFSNKISLDLGNFEEIKKDFMKNGGNIIKEECGNLLIEVKSGTFYLNKKYVY